MDELGDASVPFRFDVHALVFSDNAPALEAKLHSYFAAGRLNKINGRKEFFRADLQEIEAVIHIDAVVEVVHAARTYRESLFGSLCRWSHTERRPFRSFIDRWLRCWGSVRISVCEAVESVTQS